jgi:polar amino acid transport system ATP-binding protein
MTAPLVRVRGLRKSFGRSVVLDSVDLDVRAGEVVALLGPSGSGKSTLLRCVNHLCPPDAGFVALAGEIVGYRFRNGLLHPLPRAQSARQRASIGMVFQQFELFPNLTVLDNITEAPIAVGGLDRATARSRARELLERFGLADRADAHPGELSGGQRQRVAIARALAGRPRLMLFDEPTSALDAELVHEVVTLVRELAEDGMAVIIVTHELRFADRVADTVLRLDHGRITTVRETVSKS